jgi:regulatory protein
MADQVYTVKVAFEKAAKFCAYQERNQQEVRKKLNSFHLTELEVETVISELIEQNFLNEERYAKAYARGKFNQKHWGKLKITQGLKAAEISEYCIRKGLAEIDEQDYLHTLENLAEKNQYRYAGPTTFVVKGKLVQYLQSRGFESDLIWDTVNNLNYDDK